jgi:hypothetical protein
MCCPVNKGIQQVAKEKSRKKCPGIYRITDDVKKYVENTEQN